MARLSTCKKCEKKITKDEKYTHSNKTYCKECYDKIKSEQEQRELFIRTVCNYMNIESPTGIMLKQLKEYKLEFNYSYSGMNYTLWYFVNILGKVPQTKYGLAFIKYHYHDARKYYEQQSKIKESLNNIEFEIKEKRVKIKKKERSLRNDLLFNLNDLLKGE